MPLPTRIRLAASLALLGALCLPLRGTAALCPGSDPRLELPTPLGTIVVQLHPAAAPETVARLVGLVEAPLYSDEVLALVGDADAGPGPTAEVEVPGVFDGLAFTTVLGKREIRTETRFPAELFTLPTEIDAAALGLEDDVVADTAEAMDTLQFDLLEHWGEVRGTPRETEQLRRWAERYRADPDPSFLVGVSRREVLEAEGYVFREGLESRPVVRGAVSLVPRSPERAELALSIALTDFPRRRGRWMVVGTVVEGLDVADAIGSRPNLQRFTQRKGDAHRPVDPVALGDVRIVCPAADDAGRPPSDP